MTVDKLVRLLEVEITSEQLHACRYLEGRGFRFCVDFGYENAVEKARADWRKRN